MTLLDVCSPSCFDEDYDQQYRSQECWEVGLRDEGDEGAGGKRGGRDAGSSPAIQGAGQNSQDEPDRRFTKRQ